VNVLLSVLRRAVALFALVVLLAGCGGDFPPWSAPASTAPVAVRMTASGEIETLLVACTPARIARFEVIAPSDGVLDETDPRVGVAPPGGAVRIPWPAAGLPGESEASYVVRAVLEDGERWDLGFRPERIANGEVRFRERDLSPETFAEQSRCP
jgi:hypothetical protein